MTMRWTIRAKLAALVLAVLLPLVGGAVCEFWLDVTRRLLTSRPAVE